MVKLKAITDFLEQWAPLPLQENFDNSGLQFGDKNQDIEKVLVTLDITEEVVQEAAERGCQLIIAHHPLIFGSLKSLTGKNFVERAVVKAIQHNIALYAIHTNLDNVQSGVNHKIGEMLGVENLQILQPKKNLLHKLVVFVPKDHTGQVMDGLFAGGAGQIGEYSECSFQHPGKGSFLPSENTDPYVGKKGERHYEEEQRIEVIVESHNLGRCIASMKAAHPYEEVAYDVFNLANENPVVGSGMLGEYPEPMETAEWLKLVKNTFGGMVRYTTSKSHEIRKIAWCGGSGSFLLDDAKAAGVDAFLSSDFKYHQFFEAENQLVIADIGHYENEQFTKELIHDRLVENFNNFAVLLAETKTNPINYL